MKNPKLIALAVGAVLAAIAYFVSGASVSDAIGVLTDKEKAKAACVSLFSVE